MKKNMPLIIIIGSSILIIANFLTSEKIDGGFWLRILSSGLIILSMIMTLKTRNKQNQKEN